MKREIVAVIRRILKLRHPVYLLIYLELSVPLPS